MLEMGLAFVIGLITGGILGYQLSRNNPKKAAKIDEGYIRGKSQLDKLRNK